MIEVQQITKQFGSKTVLQGVSLTVNKGEFLTLLGPSGCGKTTLLRIIAGLETADEGTLLCNGQDISLLPAGKRDFAIMFQSYALFPNLNAEENVAFGLKSRKIAKNEIRKRVAEAFEMVKLTGEEKHYPSQLSGGMQQRVALARAIVLRPKLLLLDEPLSALDAKVREYLRKEILMLQRTLGITTIMVTHDQEEALTMSDRIAVLKDGIIEQIALPETLYNAPQTPFVADFIGTNNFFPGELIGHSGKTGTIRPEHITLNRADAQDHGFYALIELIEFSGSTCRVYCRIEKAEQPFIVHCPASDIAAMALSTGAHCSLHFAQRKVQLFEGDYHAHNA